MLILDSFYRENLIARTKDETLNFPSFPDTASSSLMPFGVEYNGGHWSHATSNKNNW